MHNRSYDTQGIIVWKGYHIPPCLLMIAMYMLGVAVVSMHETIRVMNMSVNNDPDHFPNFIVDSPYVHEHSFLEIDF